VNISAKTEYACLAVLELASSYGTDEPVRIRKIADTHGIPSRFLVQILLQLKGAGLVDSTRGAAGGYQLIKDPSEITLLDVMSVIEGRVNGVKTNASIETAPSRVLLDSWNEVASVQRDMLDSKTFADLVQQAAERSENMYYI
jgi:Rrf2 family protein